MTSVLNNQRIPGRFSANMGRKRSISLGGHQDRPNKKNSNNKTYKRQSLPSQHTSNSLPSQPHKASAPSAKPKAIVPFNADAEIDIELPFQNLADSKDPEIAKMAEDIDGLEEKIRQREELSVMISDKWPKNITNKRPGFQNPNVLCYRHSMFQAILHVPKFFNWLTEHHKVGDCCAESQARCVACALRDLANLYWYGKTNGDRKNVTETLGHLNKILRLRGWKTDSSNEQGDPDEQFTKMMQFIQQDMGKHQAPQFEAIQSTMLASSITCSKCGHTTEPNYSEISNFALGLPPHLNGKRISFFIKAYMEDHIEGYRCEGCKKQVDVVRKNKIVCPADIVTIQIKRASFGFKCNTKISLDPKLNLTRYAMDTTKPLLYELMATVCYAGTGTWGHYIAHAKGPTGEWRKFDDKETSLSSIGEALGHTSRSFEPVLLYYKRVYGDPDAAFKKE